MEVTNKTLVFILLSAIVVSIFSTFLSVERLSMMHITGHATSTTGTANLQVNSTSSIRFVISSVNWSSGSVNSTGTFQNCTLDTNNTRSTDCLGFTLVNQPLELENDGNTNVSVAINASANGTTLFGTTATTHGRAAFQYNVTHNESGSCTGTLAGGGWMDFNVTAWTVCSSLYWDPSNNADSLRFHVRVIFPIEATSGVKQATIMATAT